MRRSLSYLAVAIVLLLGVTSAADAGFTTFESGQVRPLAMSPDGTRLFAVNTPDNRLEIFSIGMGGLTHLGAVPVGLEPVAVAARTNTEVWVVNHLSDSVSIVDVSGTVPRVTRTLLVGDEPRDIVFAGPAVSGFRTRAFITTAHRGQNSPVNPQPITQGVGRADVFVFDALNLGATLAGTPLKVITFFADTPRALAASADGSTVYAAAFQSGNRTATVPEGAVCNGGSGAGSCTVGGQTMPGGLPAPNRNFQNVTGPETGLIVKFNSSNNRWEDRLGRNWTPAIRFTLPDKDVIAISANAASPAETSSFSTVGTVLFNMAVNPANGRVYVSNTDARNEVRFEGPGVFGGSTVRGHLAEARITVLNGSTVTPRHLNTHIDYGTVPSPLGVKDVTLATPTGMAVSNSGATLYVAAFGSSKVGIYDTTQLENNTFTPNAADQVTVSGGGPSGLVLDELRGQLYVFTRFDNAISVVDVPTRAEVAHVPVYNPEPPSVVQGRPFLYDAFYTSSNGEAACAACHIFGDFDSLAWDLGNPDDIVQPNTNPFRVSDPIGMSFDGFHPMKGPMTTQSLRGMANHGPMHWRGDRTGGGASALDEDLAFKAFNVAFGGLLGRDGPLTGAEMQAFTDFILQVKYPPNPIRNLNNNDTTDQSAGRSFFFNSFPSDVFQSCNGCHRLDQPGGFFGSDGFSSFEFETQEMKIPHLRNMYQKVGMFGMLGVGFFNPGDNGNKGQQVRGFGFMHDGGCDTLFRFHNSQVFNQNNPGGFPIPNSGGFPNGAAGDPLRRQVEQFMLAFDSDLAPIVGQQVTLTAANAATVGSRIDLLLQQDLGNACDLVVKGNDLATNEQRGWASIGNDAFRSDRADEPLVQDASLRLRAQTAGQELTYTCVPPGNGFRVGIDRDEDGFFDRDELDLGTDPADPNDTPAPTVTTTTTPVTTTTTSTAASAYPLIRGRLAMNDDNTPPIDLARRRKVTFRTNTGRDGANHHFFVPYPTDGNSPNLAGATLEIYNSNPAPGSPTDAVTIPLPAANWIPFFGSKIKWLYNDPSPTAPISSIKATPDSMRFKGSGAAWPYTLDEPSQGSVVVRIIFGNSLVYRACANLPAKVSGVPPTTASNDRVDKFVGLLTMPSTSCPDPK